MKNKIFAAAFFAALSLGSVSTPALAMPMTGHIVGQDQTNDIISVRMTREERMERRRMRHERMRHHRRHNRMHGHHSRRMSGMDAMRRDSGNAKSPDRPISQQNQGDTTGGPRY